MKLHIGYDTIIHFEMGACARSVVRLKSIDGCNIEFPMFVINRSRIVRVERWSGIGEQAE